MELIDWTLEKYKSSIENITTDEEQVIIDTIIQELDKKREIAIDKKKQVYSKMMFQCIA